MKQLLHIFSKDLRHLWPLIALNFVLMAVHAYTDVRTDPGNPQASGIDQLNGVLAFAITVCWWFLTASAIYEEALAGDRQFWLARPYSRASLLGSKLLFALAFINLPLFLSDMVILGAQGLPVGSNIPWLLLRQIPVTILFVLTAFGLAAMTRNLGQFVIGALLIALAFVFQALTQSWLFQPRGGYLSSGPVAFQAPVILSPSADWSGLGILAAIACAPIIWQYATRRTAAARIFIFLMLTVVPLGWTELDRLTHKERPFKADPRVQITYDLSDSGSCRNAGFPVQVAGFGEGGRLYASGEATVRSGNREIARGFASIARHKGTLCMTMGVTPIPQAGKFDTHLKLILWRVNDVTSVTFPFDSQHVSLNDAALVCNRKNLSFGNPGLVCKMGAKPAPWDEVRVDAEELDTDQFINYIGYQLPTGLSPVRKWWWPLTFGPDEQAAANAIADPRTKLIFAKTHTTQTKAVLDILGVDARFLLPHSPSW